MHLATDDGSADFRGFVTDLFAAQFNSGKFSESSRAIFACGPPVMLRKIQEFGLAQKIETQLSLEAYMGCGFGVCVGCAVPVKNPATDHEKYKLVCQHGPVFFAEEVMLPD
jgi:dihydroorotate dehydrogenase electron transfer subunit